MTVTSNEELPINCAARNSVCAYPRAVAPRFACAPVIFEMTTRTTATKSQPEGADVAVELYGGRSHYGSMARGGSVHMPRFDYASFPSEDEVRHTFMHFWSVLESPNEVEQATGRWLEARR